MRHYERMFMFRHFRKMKEPDLLDDLIARALSEMEVMGPYADDYPEMLGYLERLTKLKEGNSRQPVSADTMALIVGNLAGILLIVAYEQKHVMTSKGFPLIIKPKNPGRYD
jgi:hypothetical protein